jgi:predicted naringenin-chalcone synthase
MAVHIHRIETALPETSYAQEWACELMQEHATERKGMRRIIRSIYRNSGIERRHSVVNDLGGEGVDPLFLLPDGTRRPTPGTGERNDVYSREASELYVKVARALVDGTEGFHPEDVTHVITISCTGFYAPGPDFDVVRALGLPGPTQRFHVGFMGCYAAFPGLRMARAFCEADPDAVVLVLSVELCTLHLQFTDNTDDLIAGAVFADGASGALVSARTPRRRPGQEANDASAGGSGALEILSFHGDLAPEGREDMAWTLGDQGFRMRLSTYVPKIIEANLASTLGGLFGSAGLQPSDVEWWAVHPGGRAVLDAVQDGMGLRDEQIAASRAVLRDCGNMSSATILFVLKELLESSRPSADQRILAMAFGPGLTIESGLFRPVP